MLGRASRAGRAGRAGTKGKWPPHNSSWVAVGLKEPSVALDVLSPEFASELGPLTIN